MKDQEEMDVLESLHRLSESFPNGTVMVVNDDKVAVMVVEGSAAHRNMERYLNQKEE